jgi:enoyl-CoA hydratase/carnithine racemase
VSAPEFLQVWQYGDAVERFANLDGGVVLVRLRGDDALPPVSLRGATTAVPIIVIGIADGDVPAEWLDLLDVVLPAGDSLLEDVIAGVEAHPLASHALALLLRGQPRRGIDDGLVAESAVYSVLQAGPEFTTWRESRAISSMADDDGSRVRVERNGADLSLTLIRPHRRNALDTRMRDELLEGLQIAVMDPSITSVHLRGEGPSFSSGGDLDEFGSRSDPATAHLVRLHRSIGRTLALLADRTTAHLHGACVGSGIELAAFAGRVVAREDTVISLPEVHFGLIPGAGGTVSIAQRIGRHRTALMALSGAQIDVNTAQAWGLVDAIDHQ